MIKRNLNHLNEEEVGCKR